MAHRIQIQMSSSAMCYDIPKDADGWQTKEILIRLLLLDPSELGQTTFLPQ